MLCEFPALLDEVVLHASCLRGGEGLDPVDAASAHRHLRASPSAPSVPSRVPFSDVAAAAGLDAPAALRALDRLVAGGLVEGSAEAGYRLRPECLVATARALLDAEDAAFDELEHCYEDGDRAHWDADLRAWRSAAEKRLAYLARCSVDFPVVVT